MLKQDQYKHIIWDCNGTLINDAWLFVDVMNGVLKERNMKIITLNKYREIFEFPVENYYKTLGFNLIKEPFQKCGLEFIHAYKKRRYEAKLHLKVNFVLSELLSMNINHSILSAQNQILLDDLTKHYKIRNYFTEIIGLNDYFAHSKVDKGIELMKKIEFDSKEVLFIGDTDHDFEVAQTLGTDCLLISHGHHCHSRLKKTGAPIVSSLEDIFEFIGNDIIHTKEKCN